MAGKRRATSELNRDNWDQEDESEEVGEFEKASEDILKRRVIKTAKRRVGTNADGSTKSIFSGFGGFSTGSSNPKSFSFLSNAASTNSADNSESKKPSFSFLSNNKASNNESGDAPAKPAFSFLSNSNSNLNNSISETDSSFPPKSTGAFPKLPFSVHDKPVDKELSSSASQSKLNELSKQLKKNDENASGAGDADEKTPDEIFLQKLRSLNLLCAEWIIKHLNENLGYILTPVFDDYKKHLEQLKEERRSKNNATSAKKVKVENTTPAVPETPATSSAPFKAPDFKQSLSKINFGTSFFAKPAEKQDNEPQFNFGNTEKKTTFELGKAKTETEITKPTFSFGIPSASTDTKSEKTEDKPKPFAFSFGATDAGSQIKNPLFGATSSNPLLPANNSNDKPSEATEDNDDQPPVKEDVNITEEGSVYDKKCKVFIKKDGNFVDHGVGFLFLKLVGDEKKCQLIVRANNKLANVIINVLLSSSIPLEKKGKNNVMVVCCPTPEAKPSVVLLKVKTEEDADQLLEMMNKHKK